MLARMDPAASVTSAYMDDVVAGPSEGTSAELVEVVARA